MEKIISDYILGVRCDAISMQQALAHAQRLLDSPGQHQIVTPNPEIILAAHKNPQYKKILNDAALALPDGAGVIWASRFKQRPGIIKERVSGVDFMQLLCKNLGHEQSIFLLGAWEGVAEKVAEVLRKRLPHLKIVGTHCGSPRPEDFLEIKAKINHAKPTVLFVAFGAPRQELWIAEYLHQLPSVKLAIGVGGSFDFISGSKKRAPLWMQRMSLEWLFRLIQEPSRIKRIFNAVVKFPYTVIRNR